MPADILTPAAFDDNPIRFDFDKNVPHPLDLQHQPPQRGILVLSP
ncbi:hypothetical protein [Paraburkholderia sp. PGU19]|nr:hypothetical protein [Paraburkholderia sp. PGU19]